MIELSGTTAALVFIASLLLLAYSSDWFTEGSAKVARRIGVSKFIIGIVVVGFGTSLPELATSVYASLIGSSGVAVGNAVGSNIANIALVLGVSCLLRPIRVRGHEVKEGVIGLLIMLLASILLLQNRDVARVEGLLLLSIFILYLRYALRNPGNHRAPEPGEKILGEALRVLAGLGGVLLGSVFLVRSAVVLARLLGVPESVIGLTMVALGTSVPELAVALAAARKGYVTMLLGNILGSNIMNILLVLGAASLVMPLVVEVKIVSVALPVMLFLSLLLAVFMRMKGEIRWGEGLVFLGVYALFLGLSFS